MGFKASEHMSALEYHFGPEHTHNNVAIKGCTPEPSTAAVNRFNNRMAKIAVDHGFKIDDPNNLAEVTKVFETMTAEHMDAMDGDAREIMAELCDGLPSRDEIFQIRHRPFQAWLGWMQGELSNPEGSTGATVTSLPRRSAG